MNLILKKFCALCFAAGLLFFALEFKAAAQKPENPLSPADQREIVRVLLKEKFDNSSGEKTIRISTKNLSRELQTDFPQIKKLKTQIVSENSAGCLYEFGKFGAADEYITVSFGNCDEALAYNFKKVRGKWKIVPFIKSK